MKLNSKKYICLLVLLGLVLSPLYTYAKSRDEYFKEDKHRQKNKGDRISAIHQQLDLSPDQAEQLQNLRNTYREKATQFRTGIKVKKEELKKELQKQELDMVTINQLHSELKMILCQREDNRLEHILEVRHILTPEQLEKFFELNDNFRKKSKSKRGKRKK